MWDVEAPLKSFDIEGPLNACDVDGPLNGGERVWSAVECAIGDTSGNAGEGVVVHGGDLDFTRVLFAGGGGEL